MLSLVAQITLHHFSHTIHAFERTRENNQEFGNAAQAGKLMRDALRPLALNASDGRITSRLTQLMAQIKNLDPDSVRGQRRVAVGVNVPEGLAKLKGVEFNKQSSLSSILFKTYSVDTSTGEIEINGLVPVNDVVIPQGATHLEFVGGFANVNFEDGETDLTLSPVQVLEVNSTMSDILLVPDGVPNGSGIRMYLLRLSFFQKVNGELYPLKNGAYNALKVIEVA